MRRDRRDLERKPLGHRRRAEANAVLALEQRAERPGDELVLRRIAVDARIGKCVDQPSRAQRKAAIADVHAVGVPEPPRAQIVAVEEPRIPGVGVQHIAVPLHQQYVRRGDMGRETLEDQPRVRGARIDRRDRHDFDAGRHVDARRNRVGEPERAREADAFAVERASARAASA